MKVSLTIPVFNEEAQLPDSMRRLHQYLQGSFKFSYEVLVADNGSTDGTLAVAGELARQYPHVRVLHLDQKGRGGALCHAWMQSSADILSYMDVDLSTDLGAFLPLVESLISGNYDLATGTRLSRESWTTRCIKREVVSRIYNWLVRAAFHTRFSDAQCGFKAITQRVAREVLPLVEDTGWFWDTELLVRVEKLGYRVYDLPIRWVEDRDSRVKIWRTAWSDLQGIARLRRSLRQRLGDGHSQKSGSIVTGAQSGHNLPNRIRAARGNQ